MKIEQNYDGQAESFDERTGLSWQTCQSIATAVQQLAGLTPGDTLLEVGAGTGEIGSYLIRLPGAYIGFDLSGPMLEKFRVRLSGPPPDTTILQADGCHAWPAADHSVRVVFSSRTLHLLPVEHVVSEFYRVAATQKAILLIGRAIRDENSVKAVMRKQMRQLLKQQGVQGLSGRKNRGQIITVCLQRGARKIEQISVASWETHFSPIDSITSWESKPGLAGKTVSQNVKQCVMEQLRDWAMQEFGSLTGPLPCTENYIMEGVEI